jgi:hypothetical protein
MSDDLFRRLTDYRSDLDAAIEAERSTALVEPIETPRPPRRHMLLAVGVMALVVGAIGLVIATNRGNSSQRSIAGVDDTSLATVPDSSSVTSPAPTTTIDTSDSWDWLAQFGAEVTPPAVPDGWQIMDFEDFRFAVPADWTVPSTGVCTSTSSGVVLIAATEATTCTSDDSPPGSILAIGPAVPDSTSGTPVTIGTLSATQFPEKCSGCPLIYRFDNGYQVSVTGPDADEVLGTFTESGARRVLQSGDEADTTTWQTVEYQGITFKVPVQWPIVDLPGSYTSVTDPDGSLVQESGQIDPGACGTMFYSDLGAQVYLGISRFFPSCAAQTSYNLAPRDGLWIRSTADSRSQPDGTPIASGVVDGLDVFLIRMHRTEAGAPTPVLDLVVRDGSAPAIWITLGVGTDVSTARAILRSLRVA